MRDGWLFTSFKFDLLTANEMGRERNLPALCGRERANSFGPVLATYNTGRRKLSIELFILGPDRPITGGTMVSKVNIDIVKALPITWNPGIGMTSRGQE
jgi:hypothetical protein